MENPWYGKFFRDPIYRKPLIFATVVTVLLSTAVMVNKRFLSHPSFPKRSRLSLRCYDDMPSTNSDETWGDVDTWENNRRNQTVKMYIHLQMFNSSPFKDAGLEDDPASCLRQGTLLKTNMAGGKITMFKRRYIFKWLFLYCHVNFRGSKFSVANCQTSRE